MCHLTQFLRLKECLCCSFQRFKFIFNRTYVYVSYNNSKKNYFYLIHARLKMKYHQTICRDKQKKILNLTNYPGFLNPLQNSYLSCNFYHMFHSSVPYEPQVFTLHPNSPILEQSVTKIFESHYIFIKKFWKVLDLFKDTQRLPTAWFNILPSLEKLYQAVMARNDQANFQPTLNKRAGGCKSHYYCD